MKYSEVVREDVPMWIFVFSIHLILGFAIPASVELFTKGLIAFPLGALNSVTGIEEVVTMAWIGYLILRLVTVGLAWLSGIAQLFVGSWIYNYSFDRWSTFIGQVVGFSIFSYVALSLGTFSGWVAIIVNPIKVDLIAWIFKYLPGFGLASFVIFFDATEYDDPNQTTNSNTPDIQSSPSRSKSMSVKNKKQAAAANTPDGTPGTPETATGGRTPPQARDGFPAPVDPPDRSVWQHSPSVGFSDVAGYDDEKYKIINSIGDFGASRAGSAGTTSHLNTDSARSILLYGPPGTGKTHLARAIAGEMGGVYIELSAADILSAQINKSPIRVKELFLDAMLIDRPTVILIDDLEALIPKREQDIPHTHRQVATELLKRIEDVDQGSRILFIGATNRPDVLDETAKSPSRFDLRIELQKPRASDREDLIREKLSDRPHSITASDFEWLVEETQGLSCAEISQVVEDAVQKAQLRDGDEIQPGDFTKVLLS